VIFFGCFYAFAARESLFRLNRDAVLPFEGDRNVFSILGRTIPPRAISANHGQLVNFSPFLVKRFLLGGYVWLFLFCSGELRFGGFLW